MSDAPVTSLMCSNRFRRKLAASLVSEEFSALAPLRIKQAISSEVLLISPVPSAFPNVLGLNFCRALTIAFKLIPLLAEVEVFLLDNVPFRLEAISFGFG